MYRKALTIAAIILPALSVAAVAAAGPRVAPADEKPPMSARAGEPQTRGTAANPPAFSQADANRDGRIEPNEALAIGIPFATLDIDGDHIVTRAEYSIATAQHYAHG